MDIKVTYLPRLDSAVGTGADANEDHPMRKVTRQVAFDPGGWTSDRAQKVAKLFDELAGTWKDKDFNSRILPVVDAMARGGIKPGGIGIELGCGTGAYSSTLSDYFDALLCIDISFEMLANSAQSSGFRIRGDGATLPVRDRTVDGLFCINTLLFPAEVDRILTENGYLVWVSSSGNQTPIYLSPAEVFAALERKFTGVSSEAGPGTWTVFRRR
ncbi:MAG: class I SAM-dependent methyltransferase [Actinomycetota bacterium]|nr:MAG: class I SAM-dependent methyltransferase [Actinomycetota bacterium]